MDRRNSISLQKAQHFRKRLHMRRGDWLRNNFSKFWIARLELFIQSRLVWGIIGKYEIIEFGNIYSLSTVKSGTSAMTAWTRTARTDIGHRPHSTVATPNVPSLPSVLQQSYYTKEEVLRRHDPAPHRFQYPVYVCHGKWKVTFGLVYWTDLEQIMIEVMDF